MKVIARNNMRFVALDTETTGLNKSGNGAICRGHRIIEIGCVEVIDGVITGRVFHRYVNPGVKVEEKAVKIHGITDVFLTGKPRFEDIVEGLLEFIGGSPIVIHNAKFDVPFLNQEFKLLSDDKGLRGRVFHIIDTLELAREMFPGRSNTLDSLCERYGVKGRGGGVHGALSDAIILAKIAILMM